jgi:predicted transcriptional regulator
MRAVIALHKSAKATLGFLPDEGFTDRSRRGTLLAAVLDGRVVGYVLFDLSRDQVRLRHLCVATSARRHGVSRVLTDEVKRRHASRRNIVVECRRDYGLNEMWSSLGFRPVHERAGRLRTGSRLTIWEYDFGHPTLFSTAVENRELACLDHMVLVDLVTGRPEGLHSRHLEEDWVDAMVQLCVTDENLREANDADDDGLRSALLVGVNNYRNLSRSGAPWETHLDRLASLVPRAGLADHRHLARAIEGGADYFITRDAELLRHTDDVRSAFGINVLSPDGLVDLIDRHRRQDRYEPAVLQGTELVQERLPAPEMEAFVSALLNHGEGEKAHVLRQSLHQAFAQPRRAEVLVVRSANGDILGGFIRVRHSKHLEITCLRARRVERLTEAIARQLVFLQRAAAATLGLGRAVVTDRTPSPAVLRSLPAEFFECESPGTWTCRVVRGMHEGPSVLDDPLSTLAAAEFERRYWPAKVIGAGLPTYMVSIEPSYAQGLFDADLADTTLFRREPVLGLSREQVYYRSPGTSRNLVGPGRVLWYVKQKRPGHPVGHVRAVSHLLDVICDRPRTLHSRNKTLGVWSREEVERAGQRTGQAMALRLTDTELLAKPISLSSLRNAFAAEGLRFQAPQAPVRVPEHMFCRLYRASSAYV